MLPVQSEGFKGTKKDGYKAACYALFKLVGTGPTEGIAPVSINILGDFNLAGETWIIRRYYERMGVEVVATITGDGRVDDIRRCHGAALNVVQCSGSMVHLAKMMKERYGIPFCHVSYFGIEDTAKALYDVAEYFEDRDPGLRARTRGLVREEVQRILPQLRQYRADLAGKRAAIYTGGAFKAFSLVRALRTLGMETVVVGSQTGTRGRLRAAPRYLRPGDDPGGRHQPRGAGGVHEGKGRRPVHRRGQGAALAYKLGVAFCDHNHERKHALAGFEGMVNFAGRGPRLDDEPGLAVRSAAQVVSAGSRRMSSRAGIL